MTEMHFMTFLEGTIIPLNLRKCLGVAITHFLVLILLSQRFIINKNVVYEQKSSAELSHYVFTC